jgi:hypothetical protein
MFLDSSLLIALQHSGICTVFKMDPATGAFAHHGFLNHRPDEIVRSLFNNHACNSLVIVSVYPEDGRAILRCRTIKISDVALGRFALSQPILTQEMLGYPGWIELCEVNCKILTFTSETQTYKVWNLEDYAFQVGFINILR